MDNNLIIAIIREKGSGGTKIAKSVAKILDIPYYSKDSFMVEGDDGHRRLMHPDDIKSIITDNTPCVALGRCADYVIADKSLNYCSIFIKASERTRIKNLKNEYDMSTNAAERTLEEDEGMKKHFEKFTGLKWGRAKSYDMVFNTDRIKRDDVICTICETALKIINSDK